MNAEIGPCGGELEFVLSYMAVIATLIHTKFANKTLSSIIVVMLVIFDRNLGTRDIFMLDELYCF